MIQLTTPTSSGYTTHHVSPRNIARVTEAGASSAWHGIRSYVRTFDGAVLECSETPQEILEAIAKANEVTA